MYFFNYKTFIYLPTLQSKKQARKIILFNIKYHHQKNTALVIPSKQSNYTQIHIHKLVEEHPGDKARIKAIMPQTIDKNVLFSTMDKES